MSNTFKPGDRVEYVGTHLGLRNLQFMTIAAIDGEWAAIEEPCIGHPRLANLRHVPAAPDVITIPRSDLPEVEHWGKDELRIGFSKFARGKSAEHHRQVAMEQLAIAEYLDAQAAEDAKAEKESEARLAGKREGLADFYLGEGYDAAKPGVKSLINRIIHLEGER